MSKHNLEVEQGNAWEIKAGRNYIGYCDSCTSPDESGDGAVEFFGGTLSEVVEQYEDHVRHGQAMPDDADASESPVRNPYREGATRG